MSKIENKIWGPEGKKGALCVTFDNFGEAAEIEHGLWSQDDEVGNHYTAKETLPEILHTLKTANISSTFFVEGSNGLIYPDELQQISQLGHEIGFHGWRHESWHSQPDEEQELIAARSIKALGQHVPPPVGLRPPGGCVTKRTKEILQARGCTYVSAAGEGASQEGGFAQLPFRWVDVDALYFEPFLSEARKAAFGSTEMLPVDVWRNSLNELIKLARAKQDCYSVIFHPYLLGADKKRMDCFQDFIEQISTQDELWIAPCRKVADWLITQDGSRNV